MRIVVCVKHVPDVQADRAFTSEGRVDRSQGDGTLNELDENALEAAMTLVETHGGEVVVVTVGPDDAEDAVRRGLQMGAVAAVHVADDAVAGSDVFGTAEVLAAAVRRLGEAEPVDLVVTGMAALDSMTSLLPTVLAARLGLPALTLARTVSVAEGALTVTREVEGVTETLTAALPALLSVTDQANEPRYPNFQAIMAARKRPVERLTLADLGVVPAAVGAGAARTEVLSARPRPERENRRVIVDDGTAGAALAAFLVDNQLA